VKLKLDLHDIYNRGGDIDRALRDVIDEALEKGIRLVEIVPGKGSGQLKKRVLRFLEQKEIKALYDRVEKDSHNFGRCVRPLPCEVIGASVATTSGPSMACVEPTSPEPHRPRAQTSRSSRNWGRPPARRRHRHVFNPLGRLARLLPPGCRGDR
jgi:hypothetical protein